MRHLYIYIYIYVCVCAHSVLFELDVLLRLCVLRHQPGNKVRFSSICEPARPFTSLDPAQKNDSFKNLTSLLIIVKLMKH